MVYAEKIVTAIARGTVNTRWRDFADIYMLSQHHAISGSTLVRAIHQVAQHRQLQRAPLNQVLPDYGQIGQQRWTAWRRRQQLEDRLPDQFDDVVAAVIAFADPADPRHRREPLLEPSQPRMGITCEANATVKALSQNSPSRSVF